MGKRLKKFWKEETQMSVKHLNKYPTDLAINEVQIKTIGSFILYQSE